MLPVSYLRAIGGWQLSWGDSFLYDALVFRTELWCNEKKLIIRSVWPAAQDYPDRIFLLKSKLALYGLGLPEIFDILDWKLHLSDVDPVFVNYKVILRDRIP